VSNAWHSGGTALGEGMRRCASERSATKRHREN
jgi:hypothetical protein